MGELLCGVDLGGTKLSAGLVTRAGKVLERSVAYDHRSKPEPDVIIQIRDMIRALLAKRGLTEESLIGIGMTFPGHLRFREGIAITSSNFRGWKREFPIRDSLQRHFRLRTIVDNDANAQGFAEFKFGAGVGTGSMLFMTISTGIGVGIILEGKIYRGMTGTAGEFGHTIVEPSSTIRCGCGNYGCLMAHASGLGLPQLVKQKLEAGLQTQLRFARPEDATGENNKTGLELNDELCRAVVEECADYAGIGLYNLFQVFNPPAIVLGGGLMNWGEAYFRRIKDKFYALAGDMLFDPIKIVRSAIGADAGLVGAAALLLE
jgi:glucokinase